MIKRRMTLGVVVGALAFAATLRADLMPASPQDTPCPPPPQTSFTSDWQITCLSDVLGPASVTDDVHALLVKYSPDWEGMAEQACETQPMRILSDRQSSFSLCLYTLLGLGLLRSTPLVKKLSLGCVPSWYHDGGPFQIGHSLAIAPDCLSSTPVRCFIQPDYTAADHVLSQYRRLAIVALRQKSQFTPSTFAPRGPPRQAP